MSDDLARPVSVLVVFVFGAGGPAVFFRGGRLVALLVISEDGLLREFVTEVRFLFE